MSARDVPCIVPVMASAVQLQLLGQFELKVCREVRTHLLTYDKPRLMIAMLALAGGNPIARTRLVAWLWPDLSETQGKARMRHALHVLRQALAPRSDVLIVHSDRLALNAADAQVDILSMLNEGEGAIDDEMCLALYRGSLLDDLRSRIDGPLGEWVEHWRQRLNLRLDQCRARLVASLLGANQLRNALRYARHWVQVWPTEESCYRILIDLLVRTGRYEEARKVYDRCKAILADSLATAPDPALDSLVGNLPRSHALHADVTTDGAPPRYQPLAVLAIALDWHVESIAALADGDALERLDRACASIRRCAQQYGAWLAPGGGNQFVVYLGYPGACAYPVLRAANVAQALLRRALPAGLTMRIGLHAELGLCSQGGLRPDNGYFLAQTALALAGQARAGEILISAQAHLRIDEYEVHETQRHDQHHRILGEQRTLAVSRMFGRTAEYSELVDAWRACLTRQTSLSMTLSGAAGHGKSLLAASLAAQARQAGASVIWLRCLQDLRQQPLHPLCLWLLDRVPLDIELTTEEELAAMLGLPAQSARALKPLLMSGTEATSAEVAPDALQEACRAIVGDASDSSALLIVLDDAQWADPFTQECFRMLVAVRRARPMMILVNRRADSSLIPTEAKIDLPALDEQAVANLLAHHARSSKLDRSVQDTIARLAQGNPRLISMMLVQAVANGDIERPAGLCDLLCALLLDLDARTRQLAYLYALYDAPLSPMQAAGLLQYEVQDVLGSVARLHALGVLHAGPDASFQCLKVVAYAIIDLIAPAQAARLSQRIAPHLLEQAQPHIRVAPFLERAGDRRAPIWWKGAAVDALHEGLLHEAANLVARALRTKDVITDEAAREQFVLDCQLLRGSIVSTLSGPAHPEATGSLSMIAGMGRVGDVQTMVVALWAKWMTAQNTGSHLEALRLAQQLMHTAGSLQDAQLQGWAAYAVAQHYLWRGMGHDAELLLCQAEALLSDAQPVTPSPFGIEAAALVPASLGMAYGLQGKYEQAFHSIEAALDQALTGNAWVAVLLCQLAHARIHYLKGDLGQAAQVGEAVMTGTGGTSELTVWHAVATGYVMLCRVLTLRDGSALEAMERALPVIRAGMPVSVDGHLCLLARARTAIGDLEGAQALLDEAESLGVSHGSGSLLAEIHCLRGDIWAILGDHGRAQGHWRQAHAAAEAMGILPYREWADERLAGLVACEPI